MKLKLLFIKFLLTTCLFGQVGIGTIDPRQALDVNGNMIIRDVRDLNFSDINNILVIDNENVIKSIQKLDITGVLDKIIVLIEKDELQLLESKGVGNQYSIVFDGNKSGANKEEISLSTDKTKIIFPSNKAFKVTGYPGIIGKSANGSGESNPTYLISSFDLSNGEEIFSSQGYIQSASERQDDGGVLFPTITFITNNSDTIKTELSLKVFFGGVNSPSEVYLAGKPGVSTLPNFPGEDNAYLPGTYLTIEEF